MKSHRTTRRGYALPLVFIFTVLLLAALGVAWRQVGSVLNIEAVRAHQAMQDQGSLLVLAKAVRLLETGLPPNTDVSCYRTQHDETSRWYSVTYTRIDNDDAQWTVSVVIEAEEHLDILPPYFERNPDTP
jgi:hypothetical protein